MADVNVVSPDGQIGTIPAEQLNSAVEQGYQQASPERMQAHELQSKYGGVGQQLQTGLESAESGATLGGSDVIQGLAGNAEAVKARRAANPTTAAIGQIAGNIGLGAITGGFGALGLGRVATSALEGGALGAGNVVSEAGLGDPELNAQKALSEIGTGALLGGSIGAIGKYLPKAAEAAEEGITSVKDKLKGLGDDLMEKYIPRAEEPTARDIISEGGTYDPMTKKEFKVGGTPENPTIADLFDKEAGEAAESASFKSVLAKKAGKYISEMTGVPQAVKGIQALSSFIQKADETLSQQAKSIFSSSATSGAVEGLSDKQYMRAVNNINALNDPTNLMNHMENNLGPLHASLPNTTPHIQNTLQQGVQFLKSKIPAPPTQYVLDQKWSPTNEQKAQFSRYYQATTDPMSALKRVKNGTISNETMETLTQVYPRLLASMRQAVAENMKEPRNYGTKIALAKFMGEPLDSHQTLQSVMANQAAIAGPTQKLSQNMAPKVTQTGLQSLKKGLHSMTQTQRREAGEDQA